VSSNHPRVDSSLVQSLFVQCTESETNIAGNVIVFFKRCCVVVARRVDVFMNFCLLKLDVNVSHINNNTPLDRVLRKLFALSEQVFQ